VRLRADRKARRRVARRMHRCRRGDRRRSSAPTPANGPGHARTRRSDETRGDGGAPSRRVRDALSARPIDPHLRRRQSTSLAVVVAEPVRRRLEHREGSDVGPPAVELLLDAFEPREALREPFRLAGRSRFLPAEWVAGTRGPGIRAVIGETDSSDRVDRADGSPGTRPAPAPSSASASADRRRAGRSERIPEGFRRSRSSRFLRPRHRAKEVARPDSTRRPLRSARFRWTVERAPSGNGADRAPKPDRRVCPGRQRGCLDPSGAISQTA
jgi:hypothetical protein